MSDRHREQARSHKGSGVERKGCGITNQTVGASLLAIAECQATEMLNVRPSSRAGSLPQGEWSRAQRLRYHQSNCGSEPARDSGVSGNKDVRFQTVIASRLAPTRGFGYRPISHAGSSGNLSTRKSSMLRSAAGMCLREAYTAYTFICRGSACGSRRISSPLWICTPA